MDNTLENSIDELLTSINAMNGKKEKLQLSINRALAANAKQQDTFGAELDKMHEQKQQQAHKLAQIQAENGEIQLQIEKLVAQMTALETKRNTIGETEANIKKSKADLGKSKQQAEAELTKVENDIRKIIQKENDLAETIKGADSLADIIQTTQKYQKDIDEINQQKQELWQQSEMRKREISKINTEINAVQTKIEDASREFNAVNQQTEAIKKKITQVSDQLSQNISMINAQKNELGKLDATISGTRQNKSQLATDITNVLNIQKKFLKYPEFPKIQEYSKGQKLIVTDQQLYDKVSSVLSSETQFFQTKKPDFFNEISVNECSPFLLPGFSENKQGKLTSMWQDYRAKYTVKKVDETVEEYVDDDQPRLSIKKRPNSSIWKIMHLGNGLNDERQIVKVDVYDTLGNLRYVQYPSYDNEKVIGVQEQWFTPAGTIFMICQKFNDHEQFQLTDEQSPQNNEIGKIIIGLDELFNNWLKERDNEQIMITDVAHIQKTKRQSEMALWVYVDQYDHKLFESLKETGVKIKGLLFKKVSDAQLAYWQKERYPLVLLD